MHKLGFRAFYCHRIALLIILGLHNDAPYYSTNVRPDVARKSQENCNGQDDLSTIILLTITKIGKL